MGNTTSALSHNLVGQRLGPKGRNTRVRILSAMTDLLADKEEPAITLSAVARETGLGMTSLYNYFGDLTELLLAVLKPVMEDDAQAHIDLLSNYWPDDDLDDCCTAFITVYHAFWSKNERLLHLRNTMADSGDKRMLMHRVTTAQPLIGLLVRQMGGEPDASTSPQAAMATVVMTGVERTTTVTTDRHLTGLLGESFRRESSHYLRPAARLMALGIRDMRGS